MRIESDLSWYKTTCRKLRLSEYGLRVRLTSVGDGVPQSVEYRPPVGARSDAGPASYEGGVTDEDCIHPQDFFVHAEGDRELMLKHNRPCIVVVRLRFRGKRRDFAVPLRSNIAPNVPKDQYFALPPRPTTRPNCRHGIHYIKMFPITRPTSAASGPRARPTTRRSNASSTAAPSALSQSARHTSTATSRREGLALPSTSTASWCCWRARSRAPRLSLEPYRVAPHF